MLVVPPGGRSPLLVGSEELAALYDVHDSTYTLRARPGEAGQEVHPTGVSVRALLEVEGVEPGAIGYLTVPRADGTRAFLPGSDFAAEPPFPQGPALLWTDSGATHFLRPVLGPDDANADDNIVTVTGEPLEVGVHDGQLLTVTASESAASAGRGEMVTFAAEASPSLPGVSYRWSFGDGASGEGAEVRHVFGATGEYEVTVEAVGPGEAGGEAMPLEVRVGNPPAGEPGGGGGVGHAARAQGSGGSGGGSGRRSGGPGAAGRSGGRVEASGDRTGTAEQTRGETTAAPESTAKPAPLAPAPATAPVESATSSAEPRPAPAATSAPASPSAQSTPHGQIVEGVLVGAPTAAELSGGAATTDAAGASSGPASPSGAHAPGNGAAAVPLGLALLAALLGAGAYLELRRPRLRGAH